MANGGAVAGMAGFIAAALHGMAVDFVPAPLFTRPGVMYAFLIVGLALTVMWLRAARRNGTFAQVGGVLKRVVTVAFAPVPLALVSWLALAKSAAWTVTRLSGAPYVELAPMQVGYSHSRYGCDFHLEGEFMRGSLPSDLCLDETAYHRYKDFEVLMRISGRRGRWGSTIDAYDVLAPASRAVQTNLSQ